MKEKILKVGMVVILVVMLFLLTGCGDTELIREMKQSEFVYWGEETGITWNQATKKVMSGVTWEEYTEGEFQFVKISGFEKETGKYIEIIYKVYLDGSIFRDATYVDGKPYATYFDTLFKDITEK